VNSMKIQVQIYLIVEFYITIVESNLVLRQPEYLSIKNNLWFHVKKFQNYFY